MTVWGFLAALAWPAVTAWALWMFRSHVATLLSELGRYLPALVFHKDEKGWRAFVDMESLAALRNARNVVQEATSAAQGESAPEAGPTHSGEAQPQTGPTAEPGGLPSSEPPAMRIIKAWTGIESRLMAMPVPQGPRPPTASNRIGFLEKNGTIWGNTATVLRDLVHLRNVMMHSPSQVTEEDADNYEALARYAHQLLDIKRTPENPIPEHPPLPKA